MTFLTDRTMLIIILVLVALTLVYSVFVTKTDDNKLSLSVPKLSGKTNDNSKTE